MTVRLLRGRVFVEPIVEERIGSIIMPGTHGDWTRRGQEELGIKARSSHQGYVRAAGPPAKSRWGHEVPQEFKVGDRVAFVYHHNERYSEGQTYGGRPVVAVSQEEIIAVLEPS